MKHRRHALGTGYTRGKETRARIITAALRTFGEWGFEAASTRDIAAAAGVNAPALQYYFDNKKGVYLACVEHIVNRTWEYLSGALAAAARAVAENRSDAELIDAYCTIQEEQAHFMFTSEEAVDWRFFLPRLHSGEGPAAGFRYMYQHLSGPISKVLAQIVGRTLGRAPDDEETLIRTMMLTSQLHVFHFARKTVLAALNWETIDVERLALMKHVLREHTSALLFAMVKAREAGADVSRVQDDAAVESH